MNLNSATDQYFKQPDYELRGSHLARAANGTTQFSSGINYLTPLVLAPNANVQAGFIKIQVAQQLQKRKFYFAFVLDQVQRWTLNGKISFLLNGSPVFDWSIFSQDVISRTFATSGTNLLARPQDCIMPPFWVDVAKVAEGDPVLPAQVGVPAPYNESLNLLPLASCSPINTVDSVYTQFPALQYTPGIDGVPNFVYYTVVMYPYHLDIMCDAIQFDMSLSGVATDGNINNLGFIWVALACNSSRY